MSRAALLHSDDIVPIKVPSPIARVIDERIQGFFAAEMGMGAHRIGDAIVAALRSAYLQGYADAIGTPS